MATVHSLRIWPFFFTQIELWKKRFEIRQNDRDFKPGDILHLQEFKPETYPEGQEEYDDPEDSRRPGYTGRQLLVTVLSVSDFLQQPGVVVMGISAPWKAPTLLRPWPLAPGGLW